VAGRSPSLSMPGQQQQHSQSQRPQRQQRTLVRGSGAIFLPGSRLLQGAGLGGTRRAVAVAPVPPGAVAARAARQRAPGACGCCHGATPGCGAWLAAHGGSGCEGLVLNPLLDVRLRRGGGVEALCGKLTLKLPGSCRRGANKPRAWHSPSHSNAAGEADTPRAPPPGVRPCPAPPHPLL
jgi:hypothetical protein